MASVPHRRERENKCNTGAKTLHCRRRREESLIGPRRLNKIHAAKNRIRSSPAPPIVSYGGKIPFGVTRMFFSESFCALCVLCGNSVRANSCNSCPTPLLPSFPWRSSVNQFPPVSIRVHPLVSFDRIRGKSEYIGKHWQKTCWASRRSGRDKFPGSASAGFRAN